MAGTLDSSRFAYFIASELGVSANKVKALVLGTHGDLMVPIISQTTVNWKPINKILSSDRIDNLIERTRKAGAEIISFLKDSGFYAPASSVVQIVESVLLNKKETLPCSTYLEGEYNIKETFLGAPVVLGRKGIEKIVELKLNQEEKQSLIESADAVKKLINQIKM